MLTHTRRPRALLAGAAALAATAALIGSPVSLATPTPAQAAPTGATPQGFIMQDGKICNPRWGC